MIISRAGLSKVSEGIAFHLGVWVLSLVVMVTYNRPPPELLTFYSALSIIVTGAVGPPLYYFILKPSRAPAAARTRPVDAIEPFTFNLRRTMTFTAGLALHLGIWATSLYALIEFRPPIDFLTFLPPLEILTFYSILGVVITGVVGPPLFYTLLHLRSIIAAVLPRLIRVRMVVPLLVTVPVKKATELKKVLETKYAGMQKPKGKKHQELQLMEEVGILSERIPENHKVLEEYWIYEPYSKIIVASTPGSGPNYFVDEIRLNFIEHQAYLKLSDLMTAELNPGQIGKEQDIRKAIIAGAERLFKKYKHSFKHLDKNSWGKVLYYLQRNMLGFGPINSVMDDFRIEDISCDGVGSPVYVWHRRFESIPTNITFVGREVLDEYIVKLAHKSGKHVSSAYPIVDAMLYGKHRLAASFRDEVSPKGSTFTIRKFKEEPLSVVDLIELGTFSPEIAAYLWVLLEHKTTVAVIGGTGSGKTTTLNVLASLVKSGMKLVTVEETAELKIPHSNWVQLITRESYGMTGSRLGEIALFDLVRMSLRYRPDYLIVGEVRGAEAFVLFQALATGHGGLSTMHAENIEYAVKRLTSPPMNISESYVPLMNVVMLVERAPLPSKDPAFGRRVRNVWEVADYGKYLPVAEWIPERDAFEINLSQSFYLNKLALKAGQRRLDMIEEIDRRCRILKWMISMGIRGISDVTAIISEYYRDPEAVLGRVNETMVVEEKVPRIGEAEAPMPLAEKEPERKKVAASMVLDAVMGEGGSADVETVIKLSKLDTITFWNNIEALKRSGYVVTGEKADRGAVRTYIVATELGQRAHQTMRAERK